MAANRDEMTTNPYEAPAAGGTAPSAHLRTRFLTDLAVVAGSFLAASAAVPFLYRNRGFKIWLGSVVLFVAAPLLVGSLFGGRSRFARRSAGLLVFACPVVYAITDSLPPAYEMARDVLFLTTASVVVFVSSGGMASCLQSHRWRCALAGASGVLTGAAAVVVMTWLFVYLE